MSRTATPGAFGRVPAACEESSTTPLTPAATATSRMPRGSWSEPSRSPATSRKSASAAGLPAGSASNHFRTRDALLNAVVERFAARERANWDEIAAQVCPTTPQELARAMTVFAQDAVGPHRALTLADSSAQRHSPAALDRDRIWQVIDAQRLSLASLLEQLSDDEWRQPSLCAGWTVRDVAAHLTLQQVGLAGLVGMMASWRGDLDQTIHDIACRRASALPTGQIIAEIRGMTGSRRHNFGVTYLETLTDILVHGQDITVPLGRSHAMPPQAAAIAASRVLSMRWPPPLPAARNMAGFRLTATDTSWSAGEGPEVRGPMSAILLVCAGRLAALPQLAGPGAPGLSVSQPG